MTGDDSLPALLSRLLVAFTIEFDNEFEHHMPHKTALFGAGGPEPLLPSSGESIGRPWLASMAMWANGMRYVRAGGVPLRSVDGLGANLAGLERWGYIVVRPPAAHGAPRANWVVRPTRAGRFAQEVWGRLEGAIERRWEQRFGADLVSELRESLAGVAGSAGSAGSAGVAGALPLYLPMVGYADGMRTAFVSPADEQLAGVRPGLPALIARALLLVTLAYERRSRLSLPVCADILPAIGAQGARIRDLPLRSGVSREAVSAATKFLQRQGYATIGPDAASGRGQTVALTGRGAAELEAHGRRMDAIEDGWAERRGVAEVGRLRECARAFAERRAEGQPGRTALSLGLKPYSDGWRAQRRYMPQTDAFLADPWTALPSHPMVLHRGGFPDGS